MKIYRSIIYSIVIISLLTCIFYQSSINVYANEPLELGDILSGSDEVADGMSALGFNSEQIRNILSLERHKTGFYSGISIYYYDYYSFLIDRAKFASLQYSFSERLALRSEAAIDEWD